MFGKKKEAAAEWTKTGSFMHKPERGWLHSEESLRDGGVCYAVKVRIFPSRVCVQTGNSWCNVSSICS